MHEREDRVRVLSWRGSFRVPWRLANMLGADLTRITPGGPTARSMGFAGGALVGVWLLSRAGLTFGQPFILRYVAIPIAMGWVGSRDFPDGRAPWSHAYTRGRGVLLAMFHAEPGPTRLPTETPVTWDGSCERPQYGVVKGPARVESRVPVRVEWSWGQRVMVPDPEGEPTALTVLPGEKVTVHA